MTRRTFLSNIRAYKSSISEIHYGELLIKKPDEERYTFINVYKGIIQAGEGFSLTKKEARRLWFYYQWLHYPERFDLLYIPIPEGVEPKRLTFMEREQRAFQFGKWMNSSPKFNGSYKTTSRTEMVNDGYRSLELYYVPEKDLQRHAKKVGIFLIRYPYYAFTHKEMEDTYQMFDLKSGTFVPGEKYRFKDEVLEYITSLEAKKEKTKSTKSKSIKAKSETL